MRQDTRLDYNSAESLAPVLEALIFASDEPLSAASLRSLILGEEQERTEINPNGNGKAGAIADSEVDADAVAAGPTPDQIGGDDVIGDGQSEGAPDAKGKRKKKYPIELTTLHEAVELLNGLYKESGRGFRIVEIAGGYQFATRPEYAEYVARLFKEKSRRRLSGAALETLAIIAYKQPVSKLDIENIRGVNCDEVLKSLLEKNLVTITGRADAVGRPLLYGTTVDFLRHFGLHTLADLPKPREIEELMKEEAIKATTLDEASTEFDVNEGGESGMTVDTAIAELKQAEGDGTEDPEVLAEAFTHATAEHEAQTEGEHNEPMGIELDVEAMESHEEHETADRERIATEERLNGTDEEI